MKNSAELPRELVLACLALALATCGAAADGRIPIGSAPAFISAPGDYYLTADLSASGTAININSGGVSLDLNGYTVTDTGSFSAISATSSTNITIFGGAVVGGNYGISVSSVTAGVISIHDVRITGFNTTGLVIQGVSQYPAIRVTNNDITSYGVTGSVASAMAISQVLGGRISSNTLMGQSPGGSGYGMNLTSCSGLLISDNSATYFGAGISLYLSSGDKLLKNNVHSNGGNGIAVSNSSDVEAQEDLITANSNIGLVFTTVTNCVYRNNTSQGNGTNYSIPGTGVTNAGGNV